MKLRRGQNDEASRERKFILVRLRPGRNRKIWGPINFAARLSKRLLDLGPLVQRLAASIAASNAGRVEEKREPTGAAILRRLGTSIP
jgi:hypothetical protein